MKLTVFAVSLSLALFACSKKDDESKSGKKGKAGKTVTKKPAKLKAAKIASMGLALDVPEGTNITDNTKTAHFPSATVYASPTFFVTGKNDMFWKKDVAAQKADIKKSPGNKFKKFTKEKAAGDGFHLEYELISMMKKPLYSFHIRRTIGGKLVDCSTNASSPEERAKGIKMCMSLRPAK